MTIQEFFHLIKPKNMTEAIEIASECLNIVGKTIAKYKGDGFAEIAWMGSSQQILG